MTESWDFFETPRMTAEKLQPEHFDDMLAQNQDEKFSAMIGGMRDAEQTRQRMQGAFEIWEANGYGVWVLRDKTNGRVIGRAVLRPVEVEGVRELEIGYAFYEAYWGKGLATEIAREIVRLARERLGATSFVAMTDKENAASARVLAKCGFVPAGTHMLEGTELDLHRARFAGA